MTAPAPAPPYSTGIIIPMSPSPPIFWTAFSGKVSSRSHFPAKGSNSFFAKSRAISRIISCSVVS